MTTTTTTTSLRVRLGLWLFAGALALGAILLIDAWFAAVRNADRAYDSQLTAAALAIADEIRWAGDQPVAAVPAAAMRILAGDRQQRVFYAIYDAAGRRLTGNLDMDIPSAWRRAVDHESVWRDHHFDHTAWRLHGRRFDLAGWSSTQALQIWVGQTREGRRALAHRLFGPAVWRFAVLILAAGALGMVAIGAALAPLHRLRDRLRERRADDFSPLAARVPAELAELTQSLDNLLARQRDAHNVLLRFTADASHQLKTPLAGLANASEAALAERDPAAWHRALVRIHDTAGHAGRLAGQLLQLTRLSHGPGEPLDEVDLVALARRVTLAAADRHDHRDHDIGYDNRAADELIIRGEDWALSELLTNLIDNACVHTPTGTEVTVRVETLDTGAVLSVIDNGPGVAPTSLTRVLAPFERGPAVRTHGSGLGLAIVASVAERQGAELMLEHNAPHGLVVRVAFPLIDTVGARNAR